MFSATQRTPVALLVGELALLTACSSPGRFLHGTVWVDPCPPGPTAEACTNDIVPPDCDDLIPADQWEGGHLREPGASVSIAQNDRVAVTNANGEFLFTHMQVGTYAVAMTVPWTVERRQVRLIEVFDTQVDNDYADGVIAVSFTAAGILEGRVHLPAQPPPGELAELIGGVESVDVQMACPPRSATTDAEGRFRFEGVPQGTRHLTAVGVGLVGIADPALVLRARTTATSIQLEYGRPPEAPLNRPPVLDGDIVVTPVASADSGLIPVRPPTPGLARGERVALSCHASDPDGDPLQYVWSASSGSLEAGNSPEAAITAAADDIGVSCTVLDGRGGVDATHVLIDVDDTYFAGASLFSDGVILSAAYGADFELVYWTPSTAYTLGPASGQQWLPKAAGDWVAYIERTSSVDALWGGQLIATGFAPTLLDLDVLGFAATENGVAWIDAAGTGHFLGSSMSAPAIIAVGLFGDIAGSGDTVGVTRNSEEVEIYAVLPTGVSFEVTVATPERTAGRFAVRSTYVAYWSKGLPMHTRPQGDPQQLGFNPIPANATGRIALASG